MLHILNSVLSKAHTSARVEGRGLSLGKVQSEAQRILEDGARRNVVIIRGTEALN